jgi:hypothetical protein
MGTQALKLLLKPWANIVILRAIRIHRRSEPFRVRVHLAPALRSLFA